MAENNEPLETLGDAMMNVSNAMNLLCEYEEFDDLYDLLDNAYSVMFPVYCKYYWRLMQARVDKATEDKYI